MAVEAQELTLFFPGDGEAGGVNHCSLTKLPRWTNSEELIVYYFLLLYAVEILDTLCYGVAKGIFDFDASAESGGCCS